MYKQNNANCVKRVRLRLRQQTPSMSKTPPNPNLPAAAFPVLLGMPYVKAELLSANGLRREFLFNKAEFLATWQKAKLSPFSSPRIIEKNNIKRISLASKRRIGNWDLISRPTPAKTAEYI